MPRSCGHEHELPDPRDPRDPRLRPPTGVAARELTFNTPAATGRLTPFGGHVLGWQPAGIDAPVLYVSPRAVLDGSKPVRGGVPVCFPWFSNGPEGGLKPKHGPVRSGVWELREQRDDGVSLAASAEGFGITLDATFGEALTLNVVVTRTTDSPAPFELALHTYFAVSEAAAVSVTGLAGARRFDALTGENTTQGDEPIRFTGEYDRVFTACPGGQTLHDPAPGSGSSEGFARRVVITPTNLPSTIVWNPGPAKAASMKDLGEDQYPRFVCIESARVREDAQVLAPGQAFEAGVQITVEPCANA